MEKYYNVEAILNIEEKFEKKFEKEIRDTNFYSQLKVSSTLSGDYIIKIKECKEPDLKTFLSLIENYQEYMNKHCELKIKEFKMWKRKNIKEEDLKEIIW